MNRADTEHVPSLVVFDRFGGGYCAATGVLKRPAGHVARGVPQQGRDPVDRGDVVIDPNQGGADGDRCERQRFVGPHDSAYGFAQFRQHVGIGRHGGAVLTRDHGGVPQVADDQRADGALSQRGAYRAQAL